MIYFMRADDIGPVKIGWSTNVVARSFQVKPADVAQLTVIRLIDGPAWGERWLHREFADLRRAGEWFEFDGRMLTVELPTEKPDSIGSGVAVIAATEQITIRLPIARVEDTIRTEIARTKRLLAAAEKREA